MTVETHDHQAEVATATRGRESFLKGMWQALRRFMRTRPFWGAIILALGGWFVMKPMVGASLQMVVHMGMRGASPYLLGGGMILAAVFGMFVPAQRHFPAIMAMACSVLSLPFANLGGWVIGMVLGIVGSGLVFAWTPYSPKQLAKFEAKAKRKAGRKAGRRAARAAMRDQPVAG
ncbi:DUF6114 domain-containing protein [Nocardioides sp.]|uniref:DUF6114 domain-containing protein n=1 Tax=Nocardioides sp. TaxID=35761 RepID=UPI0039E2C86F